MLVGTWKNIQEIEECLTMEELQLIIKAQRDKEYRTFRFHASMKGVNLDEGNPDYITAEEALERVKKRAEKRFSGMTDEEFEREEEKENLASFGIRVEIED